MTCAACLFRFKPLVSTDERGGSESNHAFDSACNTVEGGGVRRQKILDDTSMREEQRLFRRIMIDAGARRKGTCL